MLKGPLKKKVTAATTKKKARNGRSFQTKFKPERIDSRMFSLVSFAISRGVLMNANVISETRNESASRPNAAAMPCMFAPLE